ncbi:MULTISPECIES: hypothetical protein [Rhizobium/Agrobacterium group]|uniref:Uncharacterized protein n=1 Tax=Agrobacterium vitis TaxID=373 RepID=A0ABD6HEK4_AGRVI|nr:MULTISPECIES: hypothetical protein [Rhizobium/Agrobacterium group]MUO29571.1 hypothetical protein [Agrobacterium vitis]MUO44124.1 hypothetical protein [Agrobacterium vitis]MUP13138.1 hypothetical protein [Agrobacterium vitis]
MRFFRGISVPSDNATAIIEDIRRDGITNTWRWKTKHHRPDPAIIVKHDLTRADTRPHGSGVAAACACGTIEGASYYAWQHNKNADDNTPIIIEFDNDIEGVAIDGKDFLYTILGSGDPDLSRNTIRAVFGEVGLEYAERAWANDDPYARSAIGDLMIHNPKVVSAHYDNTLTLGGRSNTQFKNAFTISLPISTSQIIDVQTPNAPLPLPPVDVHLKNFLLNH